MKLHFFIPSYTNHKDVHQSLKILQGWFAKSARLLVITPVFQSLKHLQVTKVTAVRNYCEACLHSMDSKYKMLTTYVQIKSTSPNIKNLTLILCYPCALELELTMPLYRKAGFFWSANSQPLFFD